MNPGQLLHIVVTVLIILGSAAVALACDMLKSNNERLSEVNLELRVRNEEEQRRTELVLERLMRVQADAGCAPAPERKERREIAVRTSEASGSQSGATIEEARMLARNLLATTGTNQPARIELRNDRTAEPVLVRAAGDAPDAVESNASTTASGTRTNWDLLLKRASRSTIDVTAVPAGGKPRGELIPFKPKPDSKGADLGMVRCRKAV